MPEAAAGPIAVGLKDAGFILSVRQTLAAGSLLVALIEGLMPGTKLPVIIGSNMGDPPGAALFPGNPPTLNGTASGLLPVVG